jgi:UDP-N-acetylmuramyl pentapeptide phosphotransferase/UDP-N-acetylglucosamine-1-phosphate transferase
MAYLIISFLASLIACLLVIRSGHRHSRFSADSDLSGPQKFHHRPVPRVGGIAIVVGLLVGTIGATFQTTADAGSVWLLLASGSVAFAAGIVEDLTKKVSPRMRLFATAVSAAIALWLLDSTILRTAIAPVDFVTSNIPYLASALTILVVAGIANSVNIIDGFNGLASMCVIMMMAAIGYVAFLLGDTFLVLASLMGVGAVLGFFLWNYPAGLIFLGDGGAYFLGFWVAELGLMLIHRHSEVSTLFPLLLCSYPIFETLFSIYRRKFVRGVAVGAPDGIHLHTLVYRRLMRRAIGAQNARVLTSQNSMTSPYLWSLCALTIIPAVLWWNNTAALTGFILLFIVTYIGLYWRIVRFKTPKWLVRK